MFEGPIAIDDGTERTERTETCLLLYRIIGYNNFHSYGAEFKLFKTMNSKICMIYIKEV